MNTTKGRGTPDDSAHRRPPDRGRRWPAAGALAGALLVGTLLAAGCSSGPTTSGASAVGTADGACRHLLPAGITDSGTGP